MAKILYLHDPKVESNLSMLETLFPTIEIIAPILHEDPIKCVDNLLQICNSFHFERYVIITDGLCILYASFLINSARKRKIPAGVIALNPNLESYQSSSLFFKLLEQSQIINVDKYSKHCSKLFSECFNCFFLYERGNMGLYNEFHFNNSISNCILCEDIEQALKSLFEKLCKGWVDIHYLQREILTPKGQVIPTNTALISVDGEMMLYGETISIKRIPNMAFYGRNKCIHSPSILSLLPGDVIKDSMDINTESRAFELLKNGMFKNTATGELQSALCAPFAGWNFKGVLPDWNKRWFIASMVQYRVSMPFNYVKVGHIGCDKYGHQYKVLGKGDRVFLNSQFPNAIYRHNELASKQLIACRTIDNLDKIFIFAYGFDGIMVFKRPANAQFGLALKINIVQKK